MENRIHCHCFFAMIFSKDYLDYILHGLISHCIANADIQTAFVTASDTDEEWGV